MKKIVSVIVSLIIIAQNLPVFADSLLFLTSDTFESSPTGGSPFKCVSENAVVTERVKGKNKGVDLSYVAGGGTLTYNFTPQSGKLSFSFDIQYGGSCLPMEILAYDASGNSVAVAYTDAKGSFFTPDGRRAGGISSALNTRLTISVDTSAKKIALYINRKKFTYNRYIDINIPDIVSGFGISVSGSSGKSAVIDNVAVYEGDMYVPSNKLPKEPFNKESIDTPVQDSESTSENRVFLNKSFDEDTSEVFNYFTLTPYTNTIEIKEHPLYDSKYLQLDKISDKSCRFSVKLATEACSNIVLEADYSMQNDLPADVRLFTGSEGHHYLRAKSGGDIFLPDKTVVGKLKRLTWTNVAIAVDISDASYSVYIDRKLVAQKVKLSDMLKPEFSTLTIALSSGMGDMSIDNLKVYEGTEPRVVNEKAILHNVLPDERIVTKALSGTVAVGYYSDALYTDGKREYAKSEILLDSSDVAYASFDDMQKLFGNKDSFEVKCDFKEGYFDIEKSAAKLGYKVYTVPGKCAVFSKNNVLIDEAALSEINRFMNFERPKADEILNKFNEYNKNEHPRVIVTKQKVEEMKKLYLSDDRMKEWGDTIISNAEKAMTTPVYSYKKSSNNSIQNIEEAIDLVMNLGIARWLTGDVKYADRVWDELKIICELPDWNLKKFLDVGELSSIVGMGYDWMYDLFTDEQRAYLENALMEKGIKNTYKIYHGLLSTKEAYTTWWDATNNINIVGAGGSMIGAAAIIDKYPEICSDLIENGMRGITYMLEDYYTYGKCDEGTGYWRYSLQYVAKTVTTFKNTFGTDFALAKTPGLDKTGHYGLAVLGSTGTNGFGDSSSELVNNPYVMWCASEFNDSSLMMSRLIEMDKCSYIGGVNEFIFYNPQLAKGEANFPLDSATSGIEAVSLRERWFDKGATFLGFHGGKAVRNHGHLDLGAYVVDMGGERFVIDIGAGDYAADGYFGKTRYNYYPTRAEGHNIYVINPTSAEDDYGMDTSARVYYDKLESSARGAYSTMDLTDAYKRDVKSAKRGYMLLDSRRSALVRDEISLKGESDIYWFVHTKADIEILDKTTAILSQNGVKVKMKLATNAADYSFEVMKAEPLHTSPKADNPNYEAKGIKKLALKIHGSGNINITVKYTLADDIAANNPIYDVPLSAWECEEGEPDVFPVAEMIYLNGQSIKNFNSASKGYILRLPASTDSVPQITVESEGNLIEITRADDFGGESIVKIINPQNPQLYTIYRIICTRLAPLSDVEGMTRYPVSSVTASEVPQEENMPENVIDSDFDTRWSAQGDEQWICLELDEIHKIDKIAVAFASGDARETIFTLQISADGQNWTDIYKGNSSGKTLGYEFYDVGGVNAKYVRLIGYGNTKNNWNSVTELAVLGIK